jgi:hypothetical protein
VIRPPSRWAFRWERAEHEGVALENQRGANRQKHLTVRDIDDWIFEFERTVAPRGKKNIRARFTRDTQETLEQVERLRLAEEKRMKTGKK